MERKNKPYAFIVSILTAVGAGIVFSFIFISGFKIVVGEIIAPRLTRAFEYDSGFKFDFSTASIFDGQTIISQAKELFTKKKKEEISASSYIALSIGNKNKVLLEKDADTLLPLASVTKLVTAVVASKLLDDDFQVEITRNILATEGDTAGFRLGEKFTARELMYPLLMVSSNDASEAFARAYGREEFIKEMNSWVQSIGAYRTSFEDPSGLSPQNVSTARDISIIAMWIKENMPEIIEITRTKTKTVRVHTWKNPTHFLNLSMYAGGKNGYTPEANRTGLALFDMGNPEAIYAVVILGSSYREEDTLDILEKALK